MEKKVEITLTEDEIKQVKGGLARKVNSGYTEVEWTYITVDPKTGDKKGNVP